MYSDCTDRFKIARDHLAKLDDKNLLKPTVWAEHENTSSYGVSIGVGPYVRPLYLYAKLCTLNVKKDKPICLKNVKAFKIKKESQQQQQQQEQQQHEQQNSGSLPCSLKLPCFTCQCYFNGFTHEPPYPIGNCAEYDVIGKVDPNLLGSPQGKEFESACQQHLAAFNSMNQKISNGTSYGSSQIIKIYFGETHGPKKPTVLQYKWNSETKGFKLIDVLAWKFKKRKFKDLQLAV